MAILPGFGVVGTGYVPMTTRSGRPPSHLKSIIFRSVPTIIILALGIVIGIHHPAYLSIYFRRPAIAPSILPRALPPPPTSFIPPSSTLPAPTEPIPNIVHYVYGLAPGEQLDFPYFAYLALRSAMMTLKPERVMFHCINEPEGYWWDRVRDWEGWRDESGERKGMVEIWKARDVQSIGGHQRPIHLYAHKADIIRLEVLLEHGGIYLDIDTFILRPFADHSLLLYDTVMGMESRGPSYLRKPMSDDEMAPKGLCNAIIVARKGALFLERWLESYEEFRESRWTEHSVEMPWTLARLYPTLVTVLSERAFFWPLWTDDHIHAVYKTTEYDFDKSGQLAYHAWESKARSYLTVLDPSTIRDIDTSFTRMARKFREPEEERRWLAAGKVDGAGSGTGFGEGDEEGEKEETGSPLRFVRRLPDR